MKTKLNPSHSLWIAGLLALAPAPLSAAANLNVGYVQTNYVSDLHGIARHQDARALNAWGMVAGPAAVWVNHNHAGLAVGYGPFGTLHPFSISIPGPGGSTDAGTPTGLEFNRTSEFRLTNGPRHAPATFIMVTEDGTIAAWNHAVNGSNAVIKVDRSVGNAVYKGVAIARDTNGAPLIFAADFHNGSIDVFDGAFNLVRNFTDPTVPGGYAPFNVRNIRGRLFVTFAKQLFPDAEDDEAGPGNGFVDIFDTDGTMLRRFASGGALNSPWGMAVAPRNFGIFSHALLVGNFGDGRINAYDLLTGKNLGHMTRGDGSDLVIQGLWGLAFERDEIPEQESAFVADRLYFTAGPNDENDGLFGILRPVNRKAR